MVTTSLIFSKVGAICLPGIALERTPLASIPLQRRRIRALSLVYISCIDMGPDTLLRRVSRNIPITFSYIYRALASFGGPSKLSRRLHKSPETWNASGELDFLNSWSVSPLFLTFRLKYVVYRTYKLGEERKYNCRSVCNHQ